MKKINKTVSLVIPLFNEELVVESLFKELNKVAKKLPKSSEVIFVDDGSKDKTVELLKKTKLSFKKTIIEFSRNFGHQSALLAGLELAKGDYVVSLDGDLQHPPKLIPEMIKLHKQGYDVILTKKNNGKAVRRAKQVSAQWFYNLINWLSPTNIESNSSDFRSLNKRALKALLSMPENQKFLRGMVQWIGFKSVILPFQVGERVAGKSKYSLLKMMRLATHGLTSFSTKPLYISGVFSILLLILAVVYMMYILYIKFFGTGLVEGWASVILVLLIIGAFLSLFMGLIGAYLASIYEEIKNRPNYIIRKITK